MENKKTIAKHNAEFLKGHHTYHLKMNRFGDLLSHEFKGLMNGYNFEMKNKSGLVGATFIPPANLAMPKSIDWRNHGAVTPVKNQGNCGSCWSFSATGALEGQFFRKTGKLVSLSEQNLIDCSMAFGNNGCQGGLMDYAFDYIKKNHGIDTEESYPYEAKDRKCRYKDSNKGAEDVGFVDIERNEEALKVALATVGPISIAIDAEGSMFQFYGGGVYMNKQCSSEELDHGVLAVGYGTDKGEDYWLVKNSWGSDWGESGYIRMARNKNNMCGVASYPSYPLV